MDSDLQICTLCQNSVRREGYREEEHLFCCAGCQAVYQILSSQSALSDFKNHPIFRQALKAGLISNPDLIDQIKQADSEVLEGDYIKLHLEIQNMWCPSCAIVISLILLRRKGIRNCIVDYATDLASIEFSPHYISEEKILQMIKDLGYDPASLQDPRQSPVSRSLYLRFIVAAFFSLNIMMFSYPIYASYFDSDLIGYSELFGWLSLAASIPVLFYSAWPIWKRFLTAMKVGIFGMEALVLMGVTAAAGLSIYELSRGSNYVYFDSMTVIIAFVLLGKIIESKAKFSAKDALIQLTRALPRRGRKRLADGTHAFMPLKDILPGDFLIVLTGEKIVLDGIVVEGEGACDESLMTGESMPISKKLGAKVLAGTFLQQGHLVIKVVATIEETALHHIIEMVEQDLSHKSQYVRAADRIVKWFVPIVIGLSLGTAFYCILFQVHTSDQSAWQIAILRAISILLISCPCAIGIAAPLAEAYVLNAMAKFGVIIRNRGCLSLLGKETLFICDKTGTITEGKFTVIKGLQRVTAEDRAYLKSLVEKSTHPIALAIQQALPERAVPLDYIEEVVGRGIKGRISSTTYYLGSPTFMKQQGIEVDLIGEDLNQVYTIVYFAKDKSCLTYFVLGDKLRTDAQELVKSFGSVRTLLVSGDSVACVQRVADACNFSSCIAECHPLQKRELVDRLRQTGEIITMLGDGTNDAPALTTANVGIAVVSATDISIQVSDILLTTNKLNAITLARQLAIKGQRIVNQNLFWAFIYNCLGIGLAMSGFLTPLFAAFAMVTSSLIVLLNAHRIQKFNN
jgi:heavy metal translocating P-type ATPase